MHEKFRGRDKLAKGLVISKVLRDSIAAEMEVELGDVILEVDNHPINDILDLQYYTAEDEFSLVIEKKNHEVWELAIIKESGEVLGIEVCAISVKGLKKCSNNCIFCFVQQMPPGMRESLYDQDDDYRLSLTQGSYITLSNLKPGDFRRIIEFHLSPLYISVHAWDPDVRTKLMRNLKAGKLPEQIKMLANGGITLHTQIVLIPGYNDGQILMETVNNLAAYYPAVQSIGVVPVGLTKYRTGLSPLRTVSPLEAEHILDLGTNWQKDFKKRVGKNLVYFSDEFYVLSGWDFPPANEYDDFPQLENGVGMAAKLNQEIEAYRTLLPEEIRARSVHVVTGVLAADFFRNWSRNLAVIKGLSLTVHRIINHYFGEEVSVAGLLTAGDIAAQLGNLNGDYFLIPRVMLKADEEIFLDGYGIEWLEEKVNGKAVIVENNGESFLEGVLGKELGGVVYE